MNESLDEFERELMSLRPRAASPQLKLRIEAQLDAPISLGRWYAPLALAASIAVAAAVLALFAPSPVVPPSDRPIAGGSDTMPTIDSTIPSLIAYRHALSRSEADLAALLDIHAAASHAQPSSNPRSSPEAPLRWRDDPTLIETPTPEKRT